MNDWEDDADWEDDQPDEPGEIRPWARGQEGKGLIDRAGQLTTWAIDAFGNPHHDDVASQLGLDYQAKVDIHPNGNAYLTYPDETSLNGVDRETAEALLAQLAPQAGLRFIKRAITKARQRPNPIEVQAQRTDVQPQVGTVTRRQAGERDPVPHHGQPAGRDRTRPGALVEVSHTSSIACPTCGDPLQGQYGTFCPRCSWSENDANLDHDPLSNPPDPTKDLHRAIQGAVIPVRAPTWFDAVEDRP